MFTVADARQNTGRRVNLPMPQDCVTHASDCEDIALLNQLDGFNMQARISIPFDGDISMARGVFRRHVDPSQTRRRVLVAAPDHAERAVGL